MQRRKRTGLSEQRDVGLFADADCGGHGFDRVPGIRRNHNRGGKQMLAHSFLPATWQTIAAQEGYL